MKAGPFSGVLRHGLCAVAAISLAGAAELEAQTSLTSGVSKVALIARVAPRASMRQADSTTEIGRHSGSRELSVMVRVSANTGYHLVAVGTARSPGARLWIRDAEGDFRELRSGTVVTVARNAHVAGEWLREVRYRSESTKPDDGNLLPVRYEIRVEPVI